MKMNLLKRIILLLIVLVSILAFTSVTMADSNSDLIAELSEHVSNWGDYGVEVLKATGETDDAGNKDPDAYVVMFPTFDVARMNSMGYNANTGQVYVAKNGKKYVVSPRVEVEISGKVFKYDGFDGISDNYSSPYTLLDYKGDFGENVDLSQATIRINYDIYDESGKYLATVDKEESGPHVRNIDDKNIFQLIGEGVGSFIGAIKNFVVDKLSALFTELFINIAKGIRSLISQAVGSEKEISLKSIIFGKIPILKINFWSKDNDLETSTLGILKNTVEYWYNSFQALGLVIFLAMLLYIGIKIMLSSTGKSKQKYKELLVNWLYGVIILFMFPYVMKYTVMINETVVNLVEVKGTEVASTNYEIMDRMEEIALSTHNFMLVFAYFIMLGQILALIVTYYKRLFMLSFLITIFPVVATFNVYEKAVRGGNKTLTNWTKEFVTLVFIQLVHAIVYVILIEGSFAEFNFSSEERNGNFILYILCVLFLFRAEKIVKSIFNIKSGSGVIGDLAESGAVMFTVASKAKNIFKPSKEENEEKEEMEENEKTVTQFKQQSTHQRMLEEERNAIYEARNTETTNTEPEEPVPDAPSPVLVPGYPPGLGPVTGGGSSTPPDGSGGAPSVPTDVDAHISGGSGGALPDSSSAGEPGTVVRVEAPTAPAPEKEKLSQDEIARGAAVAKKLGLNKRSKASIIKKAVGAGGKIAGSSMGIATGLAQGDVKGALDNAITFGAVGSQIGSVAKAGVSKAERTIKAEKLKADIKAGKYDKEFEEVGLDTKNMSAKKAELFRKVMASYASGTTSSGTAKGEYKMVKTLEKEAKKEIKEKKD